MIVPSFTAATSPCAGKPTGEKLADAVESKVVAPKAVCACHSPLAAKNLGWLGMVGQR